ncbi:hypothetical protein V8G54_005699 [Vigna mungo]|uniref:V-type proton ATPase subunit a n=1 Tax=Vigna mungo TaxID=3915 RepID=A0AAQ3S5R7_VIGMU
MNFFSVEPEHLPHSLVNLFCVCGFLEVLTVNRGRSLPTMDLLQSEPMQIVRLLIPTESAYRSISYLGDLSLFQFKDVRLLFSSHCSSKHTPRLFKEEMTKAGVSPSTWPAGEDNVDLKSLEYLVIIFLFVLVKLEELEPGLQINANNEKLKHAYNEPSEDKLVQKKDKKTEVQVVMPFLIYCFRLANFSIQQKIKNAVAHQKKLEFQITAERSIDSPLLLEQETTTKQIKLGFISGLVSREKSVTYEKILFRATGGNVFLKQSNRLWLNILFLIFCQGRRFTKYFSSSQVEAIFQVNIEIVYFISLLSGYVDSYSLYKRHQGQSYSLLYKKGDPVESESHSVPRDHDEFDFSEVLVHQLIHIIEFALGAVSNTASYLRFRALSLSLAYSELSSLFYDNVLLLAWVTFFSCVIEKWRAIKEGIITLLLSLLAFLFFICAFLHVLRLHWVEFQNKFYEVDGLQVIRVFIYMMRMSCKFGNAR